MTTSNDFADAFAEGEDKKTPAESPATQLREEREQREADARNEFTSEFTKPEVTEKKQ